MYLFKHIYLNIFYFNLFSKIKFLFLKNTIFKNESNMVLSFVQGWCFMRRLDICVIFFPLE